MRCCAIGRDRAGSPGARPCAAPGVRWRPEEILLLPDGSDGEMRRLRYTGPGAVLVTTAHERAERGGLFGVAPADAARTARWGSTQGQVIALPRQRPHAGRGRAVKPPIGFVYGNCVFADALDDGWAAFAVETESYEWLSQDGKRARFLALLGALEAIEADVQILRVGRSWDLERYARELELGIDFEGARAAEPEGARPADAVHSKEGAHSGEVHTRAQTRACVHARASQRICRRTPAPQEIGRARPEVFLVVSLREPERDVAAYVSRAAERHPREWLEGIRSAFSVSDRRVMKVSELERARVRADQAHAHLADYLPVRQARGVELQWLIRRAFCRGLGEPQVDGLHEPRALVFERNGEATLAPLEGDVLRWMDGYVEHRGRALKVESETGTSWQAQLVLGALPEQAQFPGARVELMFAPPEACRSGSICR